LRVGLEVVFYQNAQFVGDIQFLGLLVDGRNLVVVLVDDDAVVSHQFGQFADDLRVETHPQPQKHHRHPDLHIVGWRYFTLTYGHHRYNEQVYQHSLLLLNWFVI